MADFKLPEDISEFLAIESDDLEGFKEKFESVFIRKDKIGDDKDLIAPLFGKRVGEIETKVRNAARAYGVDLKEDGIPKGTKVDEVIDIVFNKAAELRDEKITELEAKISTPDNEALTNLQGEFDKYKATNKQALLDMEGLKNDAVSKYQELEKSTNEKFTNIQIDTLTNEANNKIKWAREGEGFDLKYKGFQAHMNENYNRSLTEDGTFIVTDKNGERIKDDKVTGEFKSYDSVLKDEAEKAGLLKVNPNGGQPIKQNGFTGNIQAPAPPQNGQEPRRINTATRG